MSYFTTTESFFVVPLSNNDEEIRKIDYLLLILEESGVGQLIEKTGYKSSSLGRKAYSPYILFTSIMGYIRLRRRGMMSVTAEIMLMCLAINIRKLFSVYKKENITNHYWSAKQDTVSQMFPVVKPKKKG